jgi:hypothetical protein
MNLIAMTYFIVTFSPRRFRRNSGEIQGEISVTRMQCDQMRQITPQYLNPYWLQFRVGRWYKMI